MRILVIGESNKDIFHYGESLRLCPDAPVPVFNLLHTNETNGMAKNVENNLKSLGAKTHLITNQNYDNITKTRFIDNRTNHMFLRVDKNDNNYGMLTEEDIRFINFSEFDAVIISDYNKGFLPIELLELVSDKHPLTFIDTKRRIGSWITKFSFIKLNFSEFNLNKEYITEEMMNNIIVTKGSLGSLYRGNMYPVKNVEVKDTSGAGDTFVAALCYKFVETREIKTAINFANECATKVVQRRGVSVV